MELFALRRYRYDPKRAAGTAQDLQRCSDDEGSRGRKLIKITQAGQTKLTAPVHQVMVWEWRIERKRLARVRPNGLHADAQDVSLLSEQR